ncbi:MAG: TlpA family protein disulfide reductase [Terriglobales bacterium]
MATPQSPAPSSASSKTSAWNWIIIGIIIIGGLVYLAFAHRATVADQPVVANGSPANAILEASNVIGRAAPNWTLQTPSGKTLSLSQFQGHPVVLDFWATWCAPCKMEMPWWETLQTRYASQGLVIIGISEDSSMGDVQNFLAKNPINYRVVWDNQSLQNTYGVPYGLPTTLFINRQGKITERVAGLEGLPDLDKAIHGIL